MSKAQRVSRGFHRLGLFLAAIAGAVGIFLIVGDTVRLKLEDIGTGLLIGLIGISAVCLAVYGVVRAIGWIIDGFRAP